MLYHNKKAWWIVVISAAAIKLFSFFPSAVEKYYSNGLYRGISCVQRWLLGWLPFSIGDILYFLAGFYLLIKLVGFFKTIFRRQTNRVFWLNNGKWLLFWMLGVYVIFYSFWGLNYNRLGPAHQLQLVLKPYSTGELDTITTCIVDQLRHTAAPAMRTRNLYKHKRELFDTAAASFSLAAPQLSFLTYSPQSVKPSLYSYLGDYLGYTGYYNPFTGEAQVNTTVPVFVQPFTTCHEIGHQLGYAKENEANFAGYLAARRSTDTAFLYSLYFDLYQYAIRELWRRDSAIAKALHKTAPQQVKDDMKELQEFDSRYENPVEPYIRRLYAQYLKANEQPSGMRSYSEVMGFLTAYYRKYREI